MDNKHQNLVHFLNDRRESILEDWRIRSRNDERLEVSKLLNIRQFEDHIPDVLEVFNRELISSAKGENLSLRRKEKEKIARHGLHRWQQGYHLEELILDWSYLNQTIHEFLNRYCQMKKDFDASLAFKCLVVLINEGMIESVRRFEDLRKSEAAGHVRELKRNLKKLAELNSERAVDLKQITHDLRGSLSVIDGSVNLIGKGELPEEQRSEVVDSLRAGISSLRTMFDDLILLARLDAGEERLVLNPFEVEQELSQMVATFFPVAEELGLYLKVIKGDVPEVMGDSSKILRIMHNLIFNALKYTSEGGLVVEWAYSELEGHWMLAVSDTGPGVSLEEDTMAKELKEATICDRAVREDRSESVEEIRVEVMEKEGQASRENWAPGEGIGLSIVKRLCELMNAVLELDPDYKDGTRFLVHLPIAYPNPERHG